MITLRPVGTDDGIELTVTASSPSWTSPAVVLRGTGGGTQVVWPSTPAESGQTVVHRAPADQVPYLLDLLSMPTRWDLIADGCPVLDGTGLLVARVDTAYDYGVLPAAASITIALVQA